MNLSVSTSEVKGGKRICNSQTGVPQPSTTLCCCPVTLPAMSWQVVFKGLKASNQGHGHIKLITHTGLFKFIYVLEDCAAESAEE